MKLKILKKSIALQFFSVHRHTLKAYLTYKVKIIVLIHPTLIHMCRDLVCQSILILKFSAFIPCTRSKTAFEQTVSQDLLVLLKVALKS